MVDDVVIEVVDGAAVAANVTIGDELVAHTPDGARLYRCVAIGTAGGQVRMVLRPVPRWRAALSWLGRALRRALRRMVGQ